jgi:hypothetical protein
MSRLRVVIRLIVSCLLKYDKQDQQGKAAFNARKMLEAQNALWLLH